MKKPVNKGALVVRPGYEVGYGKPPEETRFKKGQSGNPKGRPKGAKNKIPRLNEERMKTIIMEEAYRTIQVRDGERTVSVPIVQAVLRSLAVNAVKGQPRAQRLFAELLSAVETSDMALHREWMEAVLGYKAEWEYELDRRERLGITGLPEPLPHPDHVIIDVPNATVRVIGPSTKEEKVRWDRLIARRRAFEEELVELKDMLETETDPGMRQILEKEAESDRKIIAMFDQANVPGNRHIGDRDR